MPHSKKSLEKAALTAAKNNNGGSVAISLEGIKKHFTQQVNKKVAEEILIVGAQNNGVGTVNAILATGVKFSKAVLNEALEISVEKNSTENTTLCFHYGASPSKAKAQELYQKAVTNNNNWNCEHNSAPHELTACNPGESRGLLCWR